MKYLHYCLLWPVHYVHTYMLFMQKSCCAIWFDPWGSHCCLQLKILPIVFHNKIYKKWKIEVTDVPILLCWSQPSFLDHSLSWLLLSNVNGPNPNSCPLSIFTKPPPKMVRSYDYRDIIWLWLLQRFNLNFF